MENARLVMRKLLNQYRNESWWAGTTIKKDGDDYVVIIKIVRGSTNYALPNEIDGVKIKTEEVDIPFAL